MNLLSIQGPSRTRTPVIREYSTLSGFLEELEKGRRRRVEENRRKRVMAETKRRYDLHAAYRDLKDALPDSGNQEVTKPILLNRGGSYSTRNFNHQAFNFFFLAMHDRDLATQHILDLEEHNKELRARIVKEEAVIEHLNQLQGRREDSFPPDMLDVPVSSRS